MSASLASLRKMMRYTSWANARLFEARADEVVHFRFVGGGPGAMTRGEILLHVANHKTYHRGYVADMFYNAGAKPPTMDLPVFVREVEPH